MTKKKLSFNETVEKVFKLLEDQFKAMTGEESVQFMVFVATIYVVYNTIVGTKELLDQIRENFIPLMPM